MKRLPVILPPDVERRIFEQVLYIAEDSIDNAFAWKDRVRVAINAIGDLPGHAIDEEASRRVGATLRKVVFEKTYLIHYHVKDDVGVVEIVNFRHGARMPRGTEP